MYVKFASTSDKKMYFEPDQNEEIESGGDVTTQRCNR